MYTNRMRMTGTSGIDVDSIVKQLMYAEGLKLDKLKETKQKLEWTQEAYRSVTSTLDTYQNTFFNLAKPAESFRSTSMYQNYKTSLTLPDGTAARGITASPASQEAKGTHKIKVTQSAQDEQWRSVGQSGKRFQTSGSYVGSTEEISFDVMLDNKTKTIKVAAADSGSAEDFAAAVNAQFDKEFGAGKASVSVVNSGKLLFTVAGEGHTLEITNNDKARAIGFAEQDTTTTKITDKTALSSFITDASLFNSVGTNFWVNGHAISTSASMTFGELVEQVDEASEGKVKLDYDELRGQFTFTAAEPGANGKVEIDGEFLEYSGGMGFNLTESTKFTASGVLPYTGTPGAGANTTMKNLLGSTTTTFTLTVDGSTQSFAYNTESSATQEQLITNLNHTLESAYGWSPATAGVKAVAVGNRVEFQAQAGHTLTSVVQEKIAIQTEYDGELKTIEIDALDTLSPLTFQTAMQSKLDAEYGSGAVKVKFDTGKLQFETGASGHLFSIQNDAVAQRLGFAPSDSTVTSTTEYSHVTKGRDAIIEFDGVQTTRPSNSFQIGDINFKVDDEAINKEITVTVESDTDKTIENIRKFVDEYNKIFENLSKLVSTSRPKAGTYSYYEPLTDTEKEAMSEDEIEKWENKAKEGFLYRDQYVQQFLSAARSAVYQTVDTETGPLSLYKIGITTSSETSKSGQLVIDETALRKAIDDNQDIVGLFTKSSSILYGDSKTANERLAEEGIAEKLNDLISNAIGTNGYFRSKAGIKGTSSEKSNLLYDQIKKQDEAIATMLTYLEKKEDHYFSMFSKMEEAV
ncbi:MAG: flagellar filament capping protein FliD, partial [Clostridiales bacterium]|nr:flagellar filament capping protein FliD [Clostridiales bacterium]